MENEEKGKGVESVGGGVGTGKGTGKSMRTRLSKLPFSNLPFIIVHGQKSCFSSLALVMALLRLRNAFKNIVFEASNWPQLQL